MENAVNTRPRQDGVWKNNKNGMLYFVKGVGNHTETGEHLVMYTGPDGLWYARPTELFLKKFSWMHD